MPHCTTMLRTSLGCCFCSLRPSNFPQQVVCWAPFLFEHLSSPLGVKISPLSELLLASGMEGVQACKLYLHVFCCFCLSLNRALLLVGWGILYASYRALSFPPLFVFARAPVYGGCQQSTILLTPFPLSMANQVFPRPRWCSQVIPRERQSTAELLLEAE
jgi:hypothetical protein